MSEEHNNNISKAKSTAPSLTTRKDVTNTTAAGPSETPAKGQKTDKANVWVDEKTRKKLREFYGEEEETLERLECLGCGSDVPAAKTIETTCSHLYCQTCTISLFSSSIKDETLFPPRCCGDSIDLDVAFKILPIRLIHTFKAKKVEYDTKDKTYCHVSRCSKFIEPRCIAKNVAKCKMCSSVTCISCKQAAHAGDCQPNEETDDLLRVAAEQGWRQCSSCQALVELAVGCNHMTCRCGAHFCYTCGAPWKTCTCTYWA